MTQTPTKTAIENDFELRKMFYNIWSPERVERFFTWIPKPLLFRSRYEARKRAMHLNYRARGIVGADRIVDINNEDV